MTDEISAALKAAGLGNDAYWKHKQSGKFIVYHWALEKAAAAKGIEFDPPTVVYADAEKKLAVLLVHGRLGDRREWSFGEAAPYNTTQTYPFAMAEKRAKDRVILKLLGLHGEAYSEEEADTFKSNGQHDAPATNNHPMGDSHMPTGKRAEGDMTVAEVRQAGSKAVEDIEAAEGDIGLVTEQINRHQRAIEQTIRRKPAWWFFAADPSKGMKARIESVIKESEGSGPAECAALRKRILEIESANMERQAA